METIMKRMFEREEWGGWIGSCNIFNSSEQDLTQKNLYGKRGIK